MTKQVVVHDGKSSEYFFVGDQFGTTQEDIELAEKDPAAWAEKFYGECEVELPTADEIYVMDR